MNFGRNQVIAMCGYGLPLVLSYALVLGGKVSGDSWLTWSEVYVPVAMGTILAISGGLKAVQTLNSSTRVDYESTGQGGDKS